MTAAADNVSNPAVSNDRFVNVNEILCFLTAFDKTRLVAIVFFFTLRCLTLFTYDKSKHKWPGGSINLGLTSYNDYPPSSHHRLPTQPGDWCADIRATLPWDNANLLLAFWDRMLPLTTCTSHEYFGRASIFPDGKGGFIVLPHALEVGFQTTPDMPPETMERVVQRSGDFMIRIHSLGSCLTMTDILDAFWNLAVYPAFMGYVVLMRHGIALITVASHLVHELRYSIECGNMNGAHNDTFEAVWSRLAISLYAGLTGLDVNADCSYKAWSRDELSRYVDMFGMQVRFFDGSTAAGSTEHLVFNQNIPVQRRLEEELMRHMPSSIP